MCEIAETFAMASLQGGFHDTEFQIFERLGEFKDSPGPSLEDVLATLSRSPCNRLHRFMLPPATFHQI
jgi:hypothetical protein